MQSLDFLVFPSSQHVILEHCKQIQGVQKFESAEPQVDNATVVTRPVLSNQHFEIFQHDETKIKKQQNIVRTMQNVFKSAFPGNRQFCDARMLKRI